MKRRDLEKRIAEIARRKGVEAVYTEGGRHTKVRVGGRQSAIPRHAEVNERTARAILGYLEG